MLFAEGDPASQPMNALANGFAIALGNALGKVALVLLSILIASPVIASMLLLWAGLRWPSLGRSIVANCVGGIVLTVLTGALLVAAMGKTLGEFEDTYYPLGAIAVIPVALWLQYRTRASFSRGRAAGIVCAVLVPVAILLNQH